MCQVGEAAQFRRHPAQLIVAEIQLQVGEAAQFRRHPELVVS